MVPSGWLAHPPLSASIMMMNTAPRSCPPTHAKVLLTSGLIGLVNSTRNSRAHGRRENDAAPNKPHMTYGATIARVPGAKMNMR